MNGSIAKQILHEAFWRGGGPSCILIPPAPQEPDDLNNGPARFRDPRAMWEAEWRRADRVVDWPNVRPCATGGMS